MITDDDDETKANENLVIALKGNEGSIDSDDTNARKNLAITP